MIFVGKDGLNWDMNVVANSYMPAFASVVNKQLTGFAV